MPRALLCFTLSVDAPMLTRHDPPAHPSPFGRWLLEQIATASCQWPAVTFHRLGFVGQEVRLVLLLRHPGPPLVVGLAVSRALRRETTRAARAAGWLEESGSLWRVGATVVVAVAGRPERSEGLAWRPSGEVRPRIPFASLRVTEIR